MNEKSTQAATLAELHQLPDDALLRVTEAALFLNIAANSLNWYRSNRIGPDYVRMGADKGKGRGTIRYRLGALREYARDVQIGHVAKKKAGGDA